MTKMRQILGAAALLAILGFQPPAVEAAAKPGPFRYAVVTANDDPQYIKVGHPKPHQYRQTGVGRKTRNRSFAHMWM